MIAPRYWIGMIALVLMWGTSYALIEVALLAVGPLEIVMGRMLSGIAVMATVCVVLRKSWPVAGATLWRLAGIGLFGNALPFLLISLGQTHIDSAVTGVLMALMPLSVLIFTHLLLPHDPLTRWHWLGVIMGLFGIVVLMSPDLSWPVAGPVSGHLMVLGAALSYGLAAVIARSLPPGNVWTNTTVILMFGVLLMLPVAAWQGVDFSGVGFNAATGSVLFLGIASTGLAGVLFLYIVAGTSASFVANINFLIPVWAVLIGVVVMNEPMPVTLFVAMALVLGGITVTQRRPS